MQGLFSKAAVTWFRSRLGEPTAVQRRGWPLIAQGAHVLLTAPTGSGKTLAAFLSAIDALIRLPDDAEPGVRVVYVSPLKALAYDIERNLRAPLAGIKAAASDLNGILRDVRVDVRTGDTPQRERARQLRAPGDILVTTPESLYLMLASSARDTLRSVHTVIVDEIHALAPVKRGAHLALTLERLAAAAHGDPQRIGLSATVRPVEEMARFLGGDRTVSIVDASQPPLLDVEVCVPVPDMEAVDANASANDDEGPRERGLWPTIYPRLLAEIRSGRSTIVFVNSRGLCERLAQRLNALAGEELVRAHHGSVSHEKRAEIETALKHGLIRGIVATSSLELGIDMGAVDRVVLVESPGSVARALQRVGRSGHAVGERSIGRIYPKFRGDLLECAVVAARMRAGRIEALSFPRNALDVLAQHVVAACLEGPVAADALLALARRSAPYAELTRPLLDAVLDMLCGRYPSTELADMRALLTWDRRRDTLSARRGAALTVRANAGVIPDRGLYGVHLGADGPRVGELDEEMVFETRTGDTIVLGASTWRVESITRDRVIVSPAPGEPGRLPFWHGAGPGRSLELGRALGAFARRAAALPPSRSVDWLMRNAPLDRFAAQNLSDYLHQQQRHTGAVPSDRVIVVERFRDELGDWRVCLLTPFGARVHGPWALAVQQRLAARTGVAAQVMYSDDGIVLRLADTDTPPAVDVLFPTADEVEDLVIEQLAHGSLFAALFRENAARSLALPRGRPGRRAPLWAQRLKAQNLLATVRRYPAFPVIIETFRQALCDVFDLDGLREVLADIAARRIRVHEVETETASPFARSLVFAYVAAFIYEQDAPLAERKAQALTLDRALLSELIGEADLRELIDPAALAEVEGELQGTAEGRRARDADELHDLLRRLGDLDDDEIAARCTQDPAPWLSTLTEQQRAARVSIGGYERWIAAQDAELYKDALAAPQGAGNADDPLAQLVRRYAHRHGPFSARAPAARYGLDEHTVGAVLQVLESGGLLVRGEIRPGGSETDWCEKEVLRRIKRRTLAALRSQAAAVPPAALAQFLIDLHRLGAGDRGSQRLRQALIQLEGVPLSWRALSGVLLPERVADFTPAMLDALSASGEFVWAGHGALGGADGRVAIYRRERAAALLAVAPPSPRDALQQRLLDFLQQHGASFLSEILGALGDRGAGASPAALREALWALVWDGQVTNDSFAPLRALAGARGARRNTDPMAGGRWSLLRQPGADTLGDTERAVALTEMLLARYAIVSREAALAEELPAGFAAVHAVLRGMEDAGHVRRGYFVDGLSGRQFALPGAVDRLRGAATRAGPRAIAVACVDPANPWGSLLPWPEVEPGAARPRRVPGAWALLVDGAPALYLAPRGRELSVFAAAAADPQRLEAALAALPRVRREQRGTREIERVNGGPVRESPYFSRLTAAGFLSTHRGLAFPPPGAV